MVEGVVVDGIVVVDGVVGLVVDGIVVVDGTSVVDGSTVVFGSTVDFVVELVRTSSEFSTGIAFSSSDGTWKVVGTCFADRIVVGLTNLTSTEWKNYYCTLKINCLKIKYLLWADVKDTNAIIVNKHKDCFIITCCLKESLL